MNNDQKLVLAQQCFFEAMLKGWANGCKPTPSARIPGFKEIPYENEMHGIRILDSFGRIDDLSTGTISIWYERNCIWFMSYSGNYRPEDIPLLKRILMQTYSEGKFIGGRGPASCPAGVGIYTNELKSGSTFKDFQGTERIFDERGIRGYHNYWGAEVRVS